MTPELDRYKKQAALAAVEFIQAGMLIGIGHGSTTCFAIEAIAEKIRSGNLTGINAIACSLSSQKQAQQLDIPLVDFDAKANIDLTIDGADEIDPSFNLIKGGGGALLREKLVAQESRRNVIIADHAKLSPQLGTHFKLPIEVSIFGWERQLVFIDRLGGKAIPRKHDNDEFVLTDQGNYLLDCDFGPIDNLQALAADLEQRAGILEHGLFLGLATDVIIAGPNGLSHQSVKRE